MNKLFSKIKTIIGLGERLVTLKTNIYSQPHVLQYEMQQAQLTHDQKVLVDIENVRLERDNGEAVIFFCPIHEIKVLETLQPGDGTAIPCVVELKKLKVAKGAKLGLYKLRNVLLHSDGTITVTPTKETVWERY